MHFGHKKEMIHFSGRRHTKTGIISTILGAVCLAGFLVISLISGAEGGKGGFWLGVVGILLLLLAVYGFVLSYKSFKKKDIFYLYPILGAVLNGFMMVLFIVLFLVGFGA